MDKKKLGSKTAKGGFANERSICKKCCCPLEYWETIVVDCDENYNDKATIYYHCDNCGKDFIIENFETGKILFQGETNGK